MLDKKQVAFCFAAYNIKLLTELVTLHMLACLSCIPKFIPTILFFHMQFMLTVA
jgi:hypothetical protein